MKIAGSFIIGKLLVDSHGNVRPITGFTLNGTTYLLIDSNIPAGWVGIWERSVPRRGELTQQPFFFSKKNQVQL